MRRFIAVDDCGTRINPMIIEGQVHGGLTDGVGMALMEMIAFDEDGNCLGGSLMDYLIPTALEVPDWETGFTVTPSPHHPIGAKGVGESATVGSPPAIVNAVVDALKPFGVRHADMPLTPSRVWEAMQGKPDAADLRRPHDDDHRRARGRELVGDARRRSCTPPWCAPSSPRRRSPGDDAIVLADGIDRGLRRRAVRREFGAGGRARRAAGPARRCCCGCCPTATSTSRRPRARAVVVNPCLSGGALEIFLRPLLPAPLVGVVGSHADRRRGGATGRDPGLRRSAASIRDIAAGATAVVVIAGHGQRREDAIRAALDAGVGYHRRWSPAASRRRRGAEPSWSCRGRAGPRPHAGRVGHRGADRRRRSRCRSWPRSSAASGSAGCAAVRRRASATRPQQAVDPVCGMTVTVGPDTPHARVDEQDSLVLLRRAAVRAFAAA